MSEFDKDKLKIYHVCNPDDVNAVISADHDGKLGLTDTQHHFQNIQNLKSDNSSATGKLYKKESSKKSDSFDDIFNNSQNKLKLPQNDDLEYQYDNYQLNDNEAGVRSSIVNFDTEITKHRLEDFDQDEFTESQHNADQDYQALLEKKMREIDMKLERECHNCVDGSNENHIIEVSDCMEESNEEESDDEPWRNISDRDVLEQVIFDPQLGMIKREIHFGIIDYFTTFTFKKSIELKIKGVIQDDPSVSRPPIYAKRFVDCTKCVFE